MSPKIKIHNLSYWNINTQKILNTNRYQNVQLKNRMLKDSVRLHKLHPLTQGKTEIEPNLPSRKALYGRPQHFHLSTTANAGETI